MKPLFVVLSLCSALVFASASSGLSADGAVLYKRCSPCHGADGAKAPHPVKGQKSDALLKKMKGYLDGSYGGAQKNMMANTLKTLTPEDLQALADYMAKL